MSRVKARFLIVVVAGLIVCLLGGGATVQAAEVFVRFKVVQPADGKFRVQVGGYRHEDPWYLPSGEVEASAGQWSPWFDASKWPLHGKLDRAGGVAEWPTMTAAVSCVDDKGAAT